MSMVKGFFFALARSNLILGTKCLVVIRRHLLWYFNFYWFNSKEIHVLVWGYFDSNGKESAKELRTFKLGSEEHF